MTAVLEVSDIKKSFGGIKAVDGVSFDVQEGEILGLIGPNGSGKTTLFNCLSKVYEPVGGDIIFAGRSLRGLRRDTVSRLRIGRTYQIPRPFGDLTVLENVAMPLMFRAETRLGRPEALAGAHRVTIAKLETGKMTPGIELVEALASALRVRVGTLLS
jgi:ABC-type branched-subunit amino acid transport system ATPase component